MTHATDPAPTMRAVRLHGTEGIADLALEEIDTPTPD